MQSDSTLVETRGESMNEAEVLTTLGKAKNGQQLTEEEKKILDRVEGWMKANMDDFIDYFNRTFGQPFRWTYTGRPVKAQPAPRPRTWREKWVTCSKNRQELALVT